MRIGVVGLGYVGLPLAATFAEAGVPVLGLDAVSSKVEQVNAGRLTVDGVLVGYEERDGLLYELKPQVAAKQRQDIGMVFQRFNLFPHMTALENIIEAPMLVKKVPRAKATARALELLERVGLGDDDGGLAVEVTGEAVVARARGRRALEEAKVLVPGAVDDGGQVPFAEVIVEVVAERQPRVGVAADGQRVVVGLLARG